MEIVAAIESDALSLQSDKKDTSAKSLPQTVSKILAKIIGKKQHHLSKTQRTALKKLKNDEKIKEHPFVKDLHYSVI